MSNHALDWTPADKRAVDLVRVLAMDAVQKAGNGHPGTAMSLAPAAYLLYQRVMRHDPADPKWPGRDRFVLSCGHSSLTLYIQLYLSGYGLTLDDLKAFRTWGSITPGHPEYGLTPGVETTTGPLGQGLGNAVGMAMAARRERGLLDPDAAPGESPFDHFVYSIASDGDIEEGITHEVSALAAVQELGNLIVHLRRQPDLDRGQHGHRQVRGRRRPVRGLRLARAARLLGDRVRVRGERPGAVRRDRGGQGRHRQAVVHRAAHDHRLARAEQAEHHGRARLRARRRRGRGDQGDPRLRPGACTFPVEEEALNHAREVAARGKALHAEWDSQFAAWEKENPERAALFARLSARQLPEGWEAALPVFPADAKGTGTRRSSGKILTALAPVLPELWGGSADLAESNNTTMEGEPSFLPLNRQSEMWPGNPYGRTLHFGIREHGMGAILNGITLSGLTRPYGGTFLQFSDYMRGAVRLAALMEIPVDVRLDARLDRPGRGRPDAPAGRAPVVAAEHPAPGHRPPRRRE